MTWHTAIDRFARLRTVQPRRTHDLALLGKIPKEPDPFDEPAQEFMGHLWPIAGDVGEDYPGLRTSVW